ncbi:Aminoglycoside phosphotransferase [Penicillium cf. griseofulvum]|uniref:Aminoglycoside phosphotransferase n=1 Tax=Penicillium cf. griseofulvum TaxID=2972120 RepID=A0A9W9M1Q3_9EURO|nr:Aminoglycoside phosphotransferase [Penicillium cf. griseofulvum]
MDPNIRKEDFPLFKYYEFDVGALCQLASKMRREIACSCDLNQRPKRGGFNWTVFILFEDGLQWVLRSPVVQNSPELSNESVSKLLASEAATLKYLKAYTDITVPDVYSYCENEFYRSLIATLIKHANMLPLAHHCFAAPVPSRNDYPNKDQWDGARDLWNEFLTIGQKADGATNRVDYIIASHALNRLISQYASNWSEIASSPSFPLCHPDLTTNNIFVDDQYSITCIIDWAFATTVPIPLLLSPPGFPQSRHKLDERFCLSFRDGFQVAAALNAANPPVGLSVPKALRCVTNSQFAWCLTRFLVFDSTDDLSLFRTMWESIYPSAPKLESYFFSQRGLKFYLTLHKRIRLEDLSETQIQQSENDLFTEPLVRHLTMISGWGFNYDPSRLSGLRDTEQILITDRWLWRWLMEFRKQQCERFGIEDTL